MVKLNETPGKSIEEIDAGAYFRCFGDRNLSHLLSRVQSLIIKYGYDLENIITELTCDIWIEDLDKFLSDQIMQTNIRIVEKKIIKKSKKVNGDGIEPDFLIFQREDPTQNCFVVELKDGHEFDTKSSAKEIANLLIFINNNESNFKWYKTYPKICGFNATNREQIIIGFKNKITNYQTWTGEEFCNVLKLNYEEILKMRAFDRENNFHVFLDDLIKIKNVKSELLKKLQLE